MANKKKKYKALNCRLDIEAWNKLDEYCKMTGMKKTNAIEKIIEVQLGNSSICPYLNGKLWHK